MSRSTTTFGTYQAKRETAKASICPCVHGLGLESFVRQPKNLDWSQAPGH